jgi:hypothetical protein
MDSYTGALYRRAQGSGRGSAVELHLATHAAVLPLVPRLEVAEVPVFERRLQRARFHASGFRSSTRVHSVGRPECSRRVPVAPEPSVDDDFAAMRLV